MASTRVYLEVGAKRTFAMALDWPGWGRSGRTGDAALAALADYAPRYGSAVGASVSARFDVVESLPGTATTDFGAPAAFAGTDSGPVPARAVELVRACWTALDRVAAGSPEGLRKGPRGGGRDRDKMLTHVIEAEAAYARKIGVKHKPPAIDDADAIAALRAEIVAVLGGAPPVPVALPRAGKCHTPWLHCVHDSGSARPPARRLAGAYGAAPRSGHGRQAHGVRLGRVRE